MVEFTPIIPIASALIVIEEIFSLVLFFAISIKLLNLF